MPKLKRKHIFVVEITLEKPCTEKEAINELRYDLNVARLNDHLIDVFVTVWNVKSFQRVHSALTRRNRYRTTTRS